MSGTDKRAKFKMRWYHRHPKYWFRKDRPRPAGHRDAPEVVRFDPEPGATPSAKPPVRIFLGTEPRQARAERVFLWSVLKHRDPARAYEIHLMKDLKGFNREGWTTGFTNYRYAIPYLAGETGRAIYNDVDQIYLADPSAMFDLDMGGAGLLCIDEGETSVSLYDCAKMAPFWRVEEARTPLKRTHFLEILKVNGLWGKLPPEWNARDLEFRANESKCFHFTTLRTQPWRPFPDQLRYEDHPDGEVWFALERSSNAARYNAFTRAHPGESFGEAVERFRAGVASLAGPERKHAAAITKLATATKAKTAVDVSANPPLGEDRAWPSLSVTRPAAADPAFAAPVTGRYDGAVSIDALSWVPEEDIPWALDELFAAGGSFVYVAVASDRASATAGSARLPGTWWLLQMELAAKRTPGRRWRLFVVDRSDGGEAVETRDGVG